ncbi:MAG: beta-propeller fold lactonase family protein [Thermoleophilia bacterium]
MPRLRRIVVLALAGLAALAALAASAPAAPPPLGGLTQLPGVAGCIRYNGDGVQCAPLGPGFADVLDLESSPDGRQLYALTGLFTIVVYARDPATGALTQLPAPQGCVSANVVLSCQHAPLLQGARDLAVSPDGAHVVVAADALTGGIVLTLARDAATGALSTIAGPGGCISETGNAGTCENGRAMIDPVALVFSPDGANVYVASGPAHVAVLSRNAATGDLSQAATTSGCMSDDGTPTCANASPSLASPLAIDVSTDGKRLFVASNTADAIAVLVRLTSGGLGNESGVERCIAELGDGVSCRDGKEVDDLRALASSPDGAHVYAANTGATGGITALRRTPGGGLELVSTSATDYEMQDVAVSPDGATVYAAGGEADILLVFQRDPASGSLAQLPPPAGCTSTTGTGGLCAVGRGLEGVFAVAVPSDGLSVYAGMAIDSSALASFARQVGPTCADGTATVTAGVPATIVLPCVDANGDPIERAVQAAPQHGALGSIAQADGTVTYFPAEGYTGPDSFTFSATDGAVGSAPATISITVLAPGESPPPAPAPDATAPRMPIGKGPIRLTAKGVARIRVTCPASESRCTGKLALVSAAKVDPDGKGPRAPRLVGLGKATFSLGGGVARTLAVTLPATGRALVTARGSLRAQAAAIATDAAGNRGTARRTLTLLPPRPAGPRAS